MNKKMYEVAGMALMSLPATKNNKINNKRRNIADLESVSAARMISATDITPEEPLIFCGKYGKSIAILQQLVKKSSRPFIIIGTRRDLDENSCLRTLKIDWENETLSCNLSEGNGAIVIKPDGNSYLELKNCIAEWDSHLIVLCIGNGLQVDQELLNLLNSLGHYILLSENLQRSIKSTDGTKMAPSDLLSSMEYILVSSIGTAGKDLLKVLPDFEYERITNTSDLSLHRDAPHEYRGGRHHRNGSGLRFSQSKTAESRCILTQEELTKMQDSNTMLIYNARSSHTWVAKIIG